MTGAALPPTVATRPRTVGAPPGLEVGMEAFARAFEEPDDTTRFPNGFEHVVNVRGTPVG